MMLDRNDRPINALISGLFEATYLIIPLAIAKTWDIKLDDLIGVTMPISPFTLGVGNFLAGLANGSRPPAAVGGPLLERAILDLLHASLRSLDESSIRSVSTTTIRARADSIIDHLYADPPWIRQVSQTGSASASANSTGLPVLRQQPDGGPAPAEIGTGGAAPAAGWRGAADPGNRNRRRGGVPRSRPIPPRLSRRLWSHAHG